MGRYYKGDIEGKFWFGTQSSTDAHFFGGEEYKPNYMEYFFDEADLPTIKEGLAKCEKELGEWQKKLDDFFNEGGAGHEGYNDEIMENAGLDPKTANEKLEWYARRILGEKILKCVKENGECSFQAEL